MSATPFTYRLASDSATGHQSLNVVFLADGRTFDFNDSHPNVVRAIELTTATGREMLAAQRDGVDYSAVKVAAFRSELQNLESVRSSIGTRLQRLSDSVTFDGEHIYFENRHLDTELGDYLLRLVRSGADWEPFAKFLEKLMSNPSKASRDALFTWIRGKDLTVNDSGNFIAYKGLALDGKTGKAVSIHSGPGIVDGLVMKGHLPNEKGSIVEMAREDVDSDTNVGCSVGLHAGTYEYASGFAQGVLVQVEINPAHVVSVPAHCAYQKLRVWKYRVLNVIDAPETLPVVKAQIGGKFDPAFDVTPAQEPEDDWNDTDDLWLDDDADTADEQRTWQQIPLDDAAQRLGQALGDRPEDDGNTVPIRFNV